MVHRVVVAPRHKRPHAEIDRRGRRRHQRPRHRDAAGAVDREQLLREHDAVAECEAPCRPRIRRERLDARGAVRMQRVRRVALRRQRGRSASRVHPGVEAVHEDDATGRRRRRREQQRVVTPRSHAGDGAGGKSTEAVGLEPLAIIDVHIPSRRPALRASTSPARARSETERSPWRRSDRASNRWRRGISSRSAAAC